MSMLGGFLGGLGGSTIGASIVSLILETKQFDAGLVKAKGRLTTASGQMSTGLNPIKGQLGLIGAAAAVSIGAIAVKAFNESAAAVAQTNAVLKSTKGVAGVTAAEVTKLAANMQQLTVFSDEEVRSAENMLLTFTEISGEVFPQATESVLDLATAMHTDLNSAAKMIGKALNDPIRGLTAMTRAGVQFTDQQKEQIKTLIDSGKLLEAQKIILGELRVQLGGSAQAAGKTFAGQMKILGNQLNDVLEVLGELIVAVGRQLLPVFKALVPVLKFAADNAGLLLAAFAGYATVKWIIPFIATLTVKLQALAGASFAAQGASSVFFASLGTGATALGGLTLAAGGFAVALVGLTAALAEWDPLGVVEVDALNEKFEEGTLKVGKFQSGVLGLGSATGYTGDEIDVMKQKAGLAAADIGTLSGKFEDTTVATRRAGRGVRRFAGLSKDALADFKESASESLNFVEASFTDLIGASHKSANGILRNMRRALRSQQNFARDSAGFLGEVREDFGPRLETAAEQMVQILAESGQQGADEMAALRGASDREIRQMLTLFARGREGADRTATRITNIKDKIDALPSQKTINIQLNVNATGSGATASDRNIADALASQLIRGQG